jgi:hypothetical protein
MVAKDLVKNIHIANDIPIPSISNFDTPSFEIGHPTPRLSDNLFSLLDVAS